MPSNHELALVKVAEADFPTRFGHFRLFAFRLTLADGTEEEAIAVRMGELAGEPPVVRIHSQCLTGDVFHSLRCDCREQLEIALVRIAEEGRGMVIYEPKEGRGIGLVNKVRAYELQDQGADTVEANEALGFAADLREYLLPGLILRYFGVESVRLLSNNPEKIQALERAGVRVAERIPIQATEAEHARRYLDTKRVKMGHLIDGF
ncbi:MAG: GTP cyclohydrolase II [Bryobacterales bacterium]|nr:GTP cyclohydrolase II [Bryobacterales bacterium]